FKKSGWQLNKIHLTLLLALLLILLRFLNLSLWWFTGKLELTHNPSIKEVNYTFLNFSNHTAAQKKLQSLTENPGAQPIIAVVYFNFLHPAVFLVQNNNSRLSPIDLGRLIVPVEPGLSTLTISLSDTVEKKSGTGNGQVTNSGYFSSSLLTKLTGRDGQSAKKEISFIMKSPETSSYLKIPFFIYFFLPLAAILVLSSFYSRAALTAFFYFPLLFFLFDFRELFFRVPFHWIVYGLKSDFFNSLEVVVAVVVLLILLSLGFVGLLNWNKKRDRFWETFIVLFFILLPFFLRF
ncbi:MAG: hypothetical protein GY940_11135, partial [bacterium]|nr:hypothetical protein [bacterium]